MNKIKLLTSIKDYFTRFQLLVKISNADSEYDINHHAESILIPILNIIFDGDFKNLNYSSKKNFESLDLLDDTKSKIGIQVTSTSELEKVKTTLAKFLKYGHEKRVDKVFIYILTEKQRSYSQDAIDKVTKKKIAFDSRKNIIDAKDIYQIIKGLNDLDKYEQINHLLEKEFSEVYISKTFTYSDFKEFKAGYKEKCITNFSRLNFFGLSVSRKPREVELYSLFVPPLFKTQDPTSHEEYLERVMSIPHHGKFDTNIKRLSSVFPKEIFGYEFLTTGKFTGLLANSFSDGTHEYPFEKVFEIPKHLVILGNPGAGKSSMIKFSICKILEEDQSVFSEKAIYDRLPLRFELHKYNQSKLKKQLGFVEYLVEVLSNEYQILISKEKVLKILMLFPTIIFFDDLDEIFDVQERLNVRNDIENFTKTYSEARVVVTSRYESYEEVGLSSLFHKVEIKNFNQEQLESYVNKWYTIEEENINVRDNEVKHCLEELKSIDEELKYNPLLLSLILILYRNDLELPTNRLSIYEGCTNTILETRDTKEKKLGINLKINSKLSVFSALAFWQFENSNNNMNNHIVQTFIKDYLLGINEFNDDHKATQAAEEFLEFAKIRSIYFENKFTHKTFLEYFTAYYIFSTYFFKATDRENFNYLLDQNLGLSSWTVVLDLLICKIDSNSIDGSIIEAIIDRQLEKNPNDALLFFLQIIKYLTHINDRIIINLFKRALQACFQDHFELKESKISHKEVLFSYLLGIFQNERFKDAVLTGFLIQLNEEELNRESLTLFAYEFSILANNNEFVSLLKNSYEVPLTPYIYLLQHYKEILHHETYLITLKDFIEYFGLRETIPAYKSKFDQKLFYGYDTFNWNVAYYVSVKPEQGYEKYQELRAIGVTNRILRLAAANAYLISSEVEPYGHLLYKLPASGYRNFLKDFIKAYFPKSVDELPAKDKFYDKFYVKHK